jgi:hypothetical protein
MNQTLRFGMCVGGLTVVTALASGACGNGTSTQTVTPEGGGSGAGGSGSSTSGDISASGSSTTGTSSTGTSSTGTSSTGTSMTSGTSSTGTSMTSGTAASGSATGDGGGCPATATTAVHVKLAVTWPTTTLTNGGSGNVDLWFRSVVTLTGNMLAADNKACGVTLPDVMTASLAGSEKIQLKFPDAMWDNAAMPTYHATGTQTGMGAGAMQMWTASVTLLGLKATGSYAMASTTWPAPPPVNSGTFPQFMAGDLHDDDGDGSPGITLTPNGASPYSWPPTSLDYAHTQADKVYVVTRTTIALTGTLDSCVGGSGTATVSQFENHVVGCHDASGMSSAGNALSGTNCTTTSGTTNGPGLVDVNRTIYAPGSATYKGVQVPDGSTCAAVRSAI